MGLEETVTYLRLCATCLETLQCVLHDRSGKIVRQGVGLSFFYFTPNSVLVRIPVASADVPFVFNEVTADFQDATIQGELTYRVSDPQRIASPGQVERPEGRRRERLGREPRLAIP